MQPFAKRLFSAGAATLVLGVAALGGSGIGVLSTGTAFAAAPLGNACNPTDGKIEGRGSTYQGTDPAFNGGSTFGAQYQWWSAYDTDICGNTPGSPADYAQNNMGTYNYTSLNGSGAGLVAADCRTDAYAGTDLPFTNSQLITGLDGTPGNFTETPEFSGGTCTPGSGKVPALSALNFAPDTASDPAGTFPNPGGTVNGTTLLADAQANAMGFPVAGSSESIEANLTAASCGGGTTPGPLDFTPQQLSDLLGGNIANWDSAELRNNGQNSWLSTCNEAVTRVVREDNSGTTAILKGYFLNVDPTRSGATGACTGSGTGSTVQPWSTYQNATLRNNNTWPNSGLANTGPSGSVGAPAGNGCSAYQSGTTSGGPTELTTLVNTPGCIGYADLNDAVNDTNGSPPVTDQSELIRANLQNAAGTNYQSPQKLSGANCDFTAVTLPEGGAASGMVSLDLGNGSTVPPDTWASDNSTQHWNATDSGSQYPICGLAFDLVYTGLSTPFGQASAISDLSNDQRRTLYSYITFVLSSTGQSLLGTDNYSALPSTWLPAIVSGFQSNY